MLLRSLVSGNNEIEEVKDNEDVFDNIDGNYSVKKLYNPKGFSIRLKKLTGKKQNPFTWLKITK